MAKFHEIQRPRCARIFLVNEPKMPLRTAPEDAKLCFVYDDREPPEANEPTSDASKTPADVKDVVMIHSPHDDGQGYNVLRMREGSVEVGAIRNIREGAPIHGDVVSLSQRKENERLYNVETLVKTPRAADPARHGPAQVATNTYRTNWEQIFGKARSSGGSDAPN
jgi:hypothetical protein